MKTLSNPSLLT